MHGDSLPRANGLLTLITLVTQLVTLQVREAVFGGMAWLSTAKYITWSDRLGLVAIIALFSLATVGAWLALWSLVARTLKLNRDPGCPVCGKE